MWKVARILLLVLSSPRSPRRDGRSVFAEQIGPGGHAPSRADRPGA